MLKKDKKKQQAKSYSRLGISRELRAFNKRGLAAHHEGKRVAISLWYGVDELLSLAVRVRCGERWIHR